ncbi:MAG TPA: LacI family DNA-binding transcriptional regulator [Ktedonosporobacter sp.]|nr:LacI family DNA-binding transcriptional regulator [Ktedonosporobacter sp.]
MQDKLTIQDIARLAGVSKATVSRVLNHNPSVSAALSERVMRIVQEHSFIPNVTATGLANGRTPLIGVLAPPMTWPAIPEIMRGVAEYIEETSYEIVLYSISSSKRNHFDVLDRILSLRMISGLLAVLPGELSRHLTARFQQGLPLVMIDDQEEPTSIPWIGIDNFASAYQATRYLLDLGHRRIAHILGPQGFYCAIERYQGYCQALQDAGIAPDPTLLLQGGFEIISGRQCAATLFSYGKKEWPSAIFAGNDQMAYGVLEVAEQQGIRVPEDIAIVGFDDNLLSAHMRPPLTTIRQPFFEMGYKAIEILLTMIDRDRRADKGQQKGDETQESDNPFDTVNTDHPIRIQLPTSLIVRASSGVTRPLTIGP